MANRNTRAAWVCARLAASILWVAPTAQAQEVSFIVEQRDFDIRMPPSSVAVGDFNADGAQDLAVAGSSLAVLLGNGDGTFQPPHYFDPGGSFVVVGDFNGDGVQDLAVAQGFGVAVLLGNGDGTFQAPRSFATGSNPTSVAVGDFNGDSIQDLAVTNMGTFPDHAGSVSILLGVGDGTFQTASNYPAGRGPRSVAVGDFNRDGVPDLVVANWGYYLSDSEGDYYYIPDTTASVLLGRGDGTFNSPRDAVAGSGQRTLAVADFNGDGLQDVVVIKELNSISILLGNGDGTFQGPRTFAVGANPQSVTVGDFNGDGMPDLVLSNDYRSEYLGTVTVLLGNGEGGFQATHSFAVGDSPVSVAVSDLNGDRVPDLVVANSGSSNVSILLGNGDGRFGRSFPVGATPISVAVGDFNGDGFSDLAVANNSSSNVSVLLGQGDGTFQPMQNFAVGRIPISVAVGDFNRDGFPDLAVTSQDYPSSGTVSVLLGNGDGTFQGARNYPAGDRPWTVVVGDFDGDGVLDLAVAFWGDSRSDGVAVLLGNGDGTFQAPRNSVAGSGCRSLAMGDFNGDGVPDLAVANVWSDNVSVLLGNGDGTFQAPRNLAAGSVPAFVVVGDFNGDRVPDLAVAYQGTSPYYVGGVSVLLGRGDGTFRVARSIDVGRSPGFLAVGDFNGDGAADLAVPISYANTVSVFLGNGDGTLQRARNFGTGSFPGSVAVGDFNGDGLPDLAVTNGFSYSNDVSVLINNTPR